MNNGIIKQLAYSRKQLAEKLNYSSQIRKEAEEGGCGVVGFCCTEPVPGKHIYEPSRQMHNRGNGKGGGIAAVGFIPEQLGVTRDILENFYMVHIAFLENDVRHDLEHKYFLPYFDVVSSQKL